MGVPVSVDVRLVAAVELRVTLGGGVAEAVFEGVPDAVGLRKLERVADGVRVALGAREALGVRDGLCTEAVAVAVVVGHGVREGATVLDGVVEKLAVCSAR